MKDCFETEVNSPVKLRLYLCKEREDGKNNTIGGWCFIVEKVLVDGAISPLYDSWERTFEDVSRYPADYTTEQLRWKEEDGDGIFSLEELKKKYRGV